MASNQTQKIGEQNGEQASLVQTPDYFFGDFPAVLEGEAHEPNITKDTADPSENDGEQASPIKTPDYFFGDFPAAFEGEAHEPNLKQATAPPTENDPLPDHENPDIPYPKEHLAPPNRSIWVVRTKTIFSLPPEIRNRIYSYALFPRGKDLAPRPYFSEHSSWRVKPPALLQASHDVRVEALPLYYAEMKVLVREPKVVRGWLESVGWEARMEIGEMKFLPLLGLLK